MRRVASHRACFAALIGGGALVAAYPFLPTRAQDLVYDALAPAAVAAAALLPPEAPGEPAVRTARHDRLRLTLLGGALLIAPATFVFPIDENDRVFVGIGVALLWGLVLLAAGGAFRRAEQLRRALAKEHQRLARSEERLRLIVDNSPLAISITDHERQLVEVNSTALELTGYTAEEFAALGVAGVTHPDDRELDMHLFRELVAGEREEFKSLKRFLAKNGDVIWGRASYSVAHDPEGGFRFAIGMVEDVTGQHRAEAERDLAFEALRESQERSWTLLSKTLEALFVIDGDGRFSWVNPATERLLGRRADELVGEHRLDLVHPEDVAAVEQGLAARLAGTDDDWRLVTYRLRHSDGSYRTVETCGTSLLGDPLVHGVLVSARDVTERAEMERAREQLEFERRLAQRLEAVGQLAAGIAHEINTPIQFVGDSVAFLHESYDELHALHVRYRELLLAAGHAADMADADEQADLEYLTERIPAAFGRIADGVERVTSIVQAMQRFAHTPHATRAVADLDEALRATATVCRNEYKYVADLELDLCGLPPVLCNVGDLNQVFLNLIVNAGHAVADRIGGADERGRIVVRSRVDAGDVVITVADDGCGIDPGVRERIFEPFFTTKDVGRGTGQGLAIARAIVEQHAGSIAFASAAGEGTTFTVRLPQQASVQEAA